MAFPTAARSLTFPVASRTPRPSSHFRVSRPWLASRSHLAMRVQRLPRFARSGAHLPLFKGQAASRLETPSVVHRSREVCPPRCSSALPLARVRPKLPRPFRIESFSRSHQRDRESSPVLARSDPEGTLRSLRRAIRQARRVDVCSPHSQFSKTSTRVSLATGSVLGSRPFPSR